MTSAGVNMGLPGADRIPSEYGPSTDTQIPGPCLGSFMLMKVPNLQVCEFSSFIYTLALWGSCIQHLKPKPLPSLGA